AYRAGVPAATRLHAPPRPGFAAGPLCTPAAARRNGLVRALLTGCWSERLPSPALSPVRSGSAVPAQRRADGPLPSPGDLVALVRDRAVAVLNGPGVPGAADTAELARVCELVVRLALSCIAAPPAEGGVADLVRSALRRQPVP
ncbi:TetR/AcrR family transcriptional regulator, partial [Streptomyces hirsutus]|uniref:TetR/AcrR family transcriptional regulator n=1 Tax=Streptomyces hirsutus TaxID=35620 RepID=UPI003653EF2C